MKYLLKYFFVFILIIGTLFYLERTFIRGPVVEKHLQQFNEQQHLLARQIAMSISDHIKFVIRYMEELGKIPNILQLKPAIAQEYLQRSYNNLDNQGLTSILLVNSEGILISEYPVKEIKVRKKTSDKVFLPLNIDEILSLTSRQKTSFVSQVVDLTGKENLGFYIFTPLFKDPTLKEEFIGAIISSIDISVLAKSFVSPVLSAEMERVLIVDGFGNVLIGKEAGQNVYELDNAGYDQELVRMISDMISGKSGYDIYPINAKSKQPPLLVAYSPVSLGDRLWSVAISAPYDLVIANMEDFYFKETYLISIIMFIFLLLMLIMSRTERNHALAEEKAHLVSSLNKEVKERTQELSKTSQFLNNILDSSTEYSITVINPKGEFILWNKGAEAIYGYTEKEMLKTKKMDLICPQEDLMDQMKEQVEETGFWEGELEVTKKNGNKIFVQSTVTTIQAGQNIVMGFLILTRDVTHQRQLENELKDYTEDLERVIAERSAELIKSHELNSQIIESTDSAICLTDDEFHILMINSAFKRKTIMSEKELIGGNLFEILPNLIDLGPKEKYLEVINSGQPRVTQQEVSQHGSEIFTMTKRIPILDEKNKVYRILTFIDDITDLKILEKRVSQEKDNLDRIIGAIGAGLLLVDKDLRIVWVNEVSAKWFEPLEKVKGKYCFEVYQRKLKQCPDCPVAKTFRSGKIETTDQLIPAKDGEKRYFRLISTPIKDQKGRVVNVLELLLDITDQKKLEQQLADYTSNLEERIKVRTTELEATHKLLMQAERMKALGEMAGGVAHDFNNLLGIILGYVQLIQMNPTDQKQIFQSIEIIKKAALDGADTVRRIQEFTRVRADRKSFSLININELVESSVEFTKARWKDSAQAAGFTYHINKKFAYLPPVLGNPSELREVMINILNNAFDAMPKGGYLTLETYRSRDEDSGSTAGNSSSAAKSVKIDIIDTGHGMSKEVQARIFDPFFTAKPFKNSGLGMSVSYGIIKRHNGSISVESSPGAGARFTISLPIVADADEAVSLAPEMMKTSLTSLPALADIKVLVIDDEEKLRLLIKRILEDHGCKVEVAATGEEGLKYYMAACCASEQDKFDIILTDLGMPNMSGWDVASAIKQFNQRHSRKVQLALITGWGIQLDADKLSENGINAVLNKPIDIDQLLNLVGQAGLNQETPDKIQTSVTSTSTLH